MSAADNFFTAWAELSQRQREEIAAIRSRHYREQLELARAHEQQGLGDALALHDPEGDTAA